MKVKTYQAFNPNAPVELDLGETLQQALTGANRTLTYIEEIRPEIKTAYISALKKRLADTVQDFSLEAASFDPGGLSQDLKHMRDDADLQNLILQFVCKQFDLPRDFTLGPDKVEVSSLNYFKSFARLSYHRTKACADVLGDESGIQLWKGIIARLLQDAKVKQERDQRQRAERGEQEPTLAETRERSIQQWTEMGLADFTAAIFDDEKVLYRFDRCLVPEALKDFEDPDFAYLCYCYTGDAEGFNAGRAIHLRRTQTLHHSDFCDEFYWDSRVHAEPPEQPSLEFTSKLGKE